MIVVAFLWLQVGYHPQRFEYYLAVTLYVIQLLSECFEAQASLIVALNSWLHFMLHREFPTPQDMLASTSSGTNKKKQKFKSDGQRAWYNVAHFQLLLFFESLVALPNMQKTLCAVLEVQNEHAVHFLDILFEEEPQLSRGQDFYPSNQRDREFEDSQSVSY